MRWPRGRKLFTIDGQRAPTRLSGFDLSVVIPRESSVSRGDTGHVEVFSKLSTTSYKIQAVNHDTMTAFSSSDMSWHPSIYVWWLRANHPIIVSSPSMTLKRPASSTSNKSIEDEQTFYDYYYHDEDYYDGAVAATASDTDHR